MTLRLQDILSVAQATLINPRRGLRMVLSLDLSMEMRLAALALLAVLSAILAQAGAALMPAEEENPFLALLIGSPLRTAAIQATGMLLTAGMVHVLGRAWGGKGRLDEAVLAVAWLQVFMVGLQAAQLVAILVLPPLAPLIAVVSVAVFPWLLTMFVTEIHGFSSPIKVFMGIVLCAVGLSFALSILLVAYLGPETIANV